MNRVESSSLKTYNNLELAFRLQLEQAGNRVSGKGEKWAENGKVLSARARTPITVEGTREGDRIELSFTERGTRRSSNGTITLGIADAATMHGSFQSDAAGAQRHDLREARGRFAEIDRTFSVFFSAMSVRGRQRPSSDQR